MATKKKTQSQSRKPAPKKQGPNKNAILGVVVAVVIVGAAAVWIAGGQKSGSAGAAGATAAAPATPAGSAAAVPAAEQKCIGRLLPAGYSEASVSGAQSYTSTIKMTNLTADMTKSVMTIPVDQVVADKIVYFEHQRPDGQIVPMIAYVKPSGKLFVGVSFCLPCKGTKDRIENGQLACESCGTIRDLETGVGISGACKLYPLDEVPATVNGGKITIQNSVLDSWTAQPQDRQVGGA